MNKDKKKKCKCVCHDYKKRKLEHDTKCCEDMNGDLVEITEKPN